MTFVAGEQALSAWMAENAYVSWVIHNEPWELEDELIAALDLPLNLRGNTHQPVPLRTDRSTCPLRPAGRGVASRAQSRHRRRTPGKDNSALTATVTATPLHTEPARPITTPRTALPWRADQRPG